MIAPLAGAAADGVGMDAEDHRRRRATLASAAFLALLFLVGLWIASLIAERQALERCLAEGRKTCASIPNEPRSDYPAQR